MSKTIRLNDGVQIPSVGFGTFLIPPDGSTYKAVREALDIGYRHIDTATAYYNEEEVGKAVRDSGIPREEIFVTSKLWVSHFGYERAKIGIERSLKKLGMDYIPESVKLKNQISSKVSLQAKNEAKSSHSKCTQKVHENWKSPAFYAIIEVDKSGIGCGKNEL